VVDEGAGGTAGAGAAAAAGAAEGRRPRGILEWCQA